MTEEPDLDELFANEVDVDPSLGANPRVIQVVVALVVAGLLIGLLVSVIVAGLAQVSG